MAARIPLGPRASVWRFKESAGRAGEPLTHSQTKVNGRNRMHYLRTTAVAGLGLFLGLSAAARAAEPDWLPSPLKRPLADITIGLSTLGAGVNAYVATYDDTFVAEAKKLGVKLILLDPQADPAKQADQVNDLIAQRVDVAVIWPVNGKAIVPSAKRVHDAGIPVVISNSKIDPTGKDYTTTFTGPDHYSEAKDAAELMIKALGGKGNVVMINGLPGFTTSQLRVQGFLDAIAAHPDIKVLDSQPANWSREKAQTLMENYIARFGKQIDGVYSADSGMGIGAMSAIQAAVKEGKLDAGHIKQTDCTLFGIAYDAIKTGDYYGSILQAPEEEARSALKAAILIAEGQTVPAENYFKVTLVTKDNVDQIQRPNL
jgi:ribose transport system substrate-binding protein